MAADPIARSRFIRNLIVLVEKHGLDGIDIDWEYPGQVGGGNVFRKQDKQNFTLMLKELRWQLDEQSTRDNRTGENKYLLTIASGGDKKFLRHTEMGKAEQYLDFINIMTYDLYNGLDKKTGHHSNLYQSLKGDHSRNSSADAVRGHVRAGVPIGKIVLGVPFYGRGWEKVKNKDNGLYQKAEGPHISFSYDTLKSSFVNKNGFKRYWDEKAKAPYLWNPSSCTFITYADEESMYYKTNFVKVKGLGGVMFWEYSQDTKELSLLDKLYNDLKK